MSTAEYPLGKIHRMFIYGPYAILARIVPQLVILLVPGDVISICKVARQQPSDVTGGAIFTRHKWDAILSAHGVPPDDLVYSLHNAVQLPLAEEFSLPHHLAHCLGHLGVVDDSENHGLRYLPAG